MRKKIDFKLKLEMRRWIYERFTIRTLKSIVYGPRDGVWLDELSMSDDEKEVLLAILREEGAVKWQWRKLGGIWKRRRKLGLDKKI
jgi:hypothetical protein